MIFGKLNGSQLTRPSRTSLAAVGLVGVMSALPSLGCDTVALISFQERNFAALQSPGLTPTADSCGGSDGGAVMRFVMIGDDRIPIRPGDTIEQEVIDISLASLSLSNTKVFEQPDELCADNSSCVFEGDNFTCSLADESYDSTLKRCQRDGSLALTGAVEFASNVDKPQLFGVVYENAGSLDGWLPEDVAQYYPDWDNDGTADGNQDVTLNNGRASDGRKNRHTALSSMINDWEIAAELSIRENRKTFFGLWQFSGTSSADVRSLVADVVPDGESFWTESPATARRAADTFKNSEEPTRKRANVYQAAVEVLEEGFGQDKFDGYDKTMVLFVDGPDDLRSPNFTATKVIDAAKEQGVRIFVVQLDAALDEFSSDNTTPLLRDDPRYWQAQDAACASDEDCESHETCRVPMAYSTQPGGTAEITPGGATYCMPQRDSNQRSGAIHGYQQIACETDGGYIYAKFSRASANSSSQALSRRMQWLPLTMDGLWKVGATLDVIENGDVAAAQPYRVQSEFSVSVGQKQQTFSFSQLGDPSAGRQDDDQDTRTILFSK